jgi:rSAM/selenodomain-associated transferase 1
MKRAVVLLARAPSAPGKTRLTAHLSDAVARDLRERLLLDTLAAAHATGYPIVVSYTPEEAGDEMRTLVGASRVIAQRGDDLGARMRNAINDALAAGAAAVVLIGSDLPSLPPEHLVRAFELLEGSGAVPAGAHDLVLGPAEDGGFYLIGASGALPDLFAGVGWSRSDVMARVSAAAQQAGLVVGLAPPWWDVDAPEVLHRCPGYHEFLRGRH